MMACYALYILGPHPTLFTVEVCVLFAFCAYVGARLGGRR